MKKNNTKSREYTSNLKTNRDWGRMLLEEMIELGMEPIMSINQHNKFVEQRNKRGCGFDTIRITLLNLEGKLTHSGKKISKGMLYKHWEAKEISFFKRFHIDTNYKYKIKCE